MGMRIRIVLVSAVGVLLAMLVGVAPADARDNRTADIYVAVLHQALQDESLGFGRMYVESTTMDQTEIPRGVQRAVTAGMHDALPTRFTDTPDRFILPDSRVRGNGVIARLDSVPAGDRVEVGWFLYFGNLGCMLMDYIVEDTDQGWTVTGDTGVVGVC